MSETFSLQKKISKLIGFSAFVIGIFNFINIFFTQNHGLVDSLVNPSVVFLFAIGIGNFIICRYDSNIARFIQFSGFYLVALLMISSTPESFFGYWILVLSFIFLYKYGLIGNKFIRLKVTLSIIPAIVVIVISNVVSANVITATINVLVFLGIVLLALYFSFEEDIMRLRQENKEKNDLIRQLEPASKLGEKTSFIVHSFKNIEMIISSGIYLIEADRPEKGLDTMKKGLAMLSKRTSSILNLSRIEDNNTVEFFDISGLVEDVVLMLQQQKAYIKHCKMQLDVTSGVFVKAKKYDVLMMIENIIKNAAEAAADSEKYGTINICTTHDELIISNNAGGIPKCIGCQLNCNQCPVFFKHHYTTKSYGTGYGMKQIFTTARESGWGIKSICDDEQTILKFSLRGVHNV